MFLKLLQSKGLIWLSFALVLGYLTLVFLQVEFIITPDSTGYLQIAKNISQGLGVINTGGKIVTHWGFCYPLMLGFVKFLFSVKIETAVFIAHFVLTILIFFEIRKNVVRIITKKYYSNFVFCLIYLLVYINGLLMYGVSVMTEYLYFYLSLVIINTLYNKSSSKNPNHLRILIIGLLCAFLFYTRYIGISLLITILFYFLLHRKYYQSFKSWLKSILFFVGTVMLLYAGWHIYLNFSCHPYSEFNRVFKYHPIEILKMREGIDVFFHLFFFKGVISSYKIKGLVLVFVGIMVAVFYVKRLFFVIFNQGRLAIHDLCFVYVAAYLTLILITLLFFDASTPLDLRIFTPIVYFSFMLLLFFIANKLGLTNRQLTTIIALLLYVALYNNGNRYNRLYRFGEGLNSIEYKNHEALGDLKQIIKLQHKKHVTVYTNGLDYMKVCYKNGGVKFKSLPLKYYPTSGIYNRHYQSEMSKLIKSINANDSVCLLFFNKLKWRKYLATNTEVVQFTKTLKLPVNIKFQGDSSFIVYPKK